MKGKSKWLVPFLLALVLAFVFTAVACGENEPAEPVLTGIAVRTAPAKTAYAEGERFDPKGMTVEAVYDNGDRKTVTDYTYTPNGALTSDVTFVTITYADKTAKQAITVRAAEPAEPELTGIAVRTAPAKTAYTEGESFDPTGMIVEAVYDNGDRKTVTDYTYTPNGALTSDVTFVTIAYADKTAKQAITVRTAEPELTEIVIGTAPTKTEYIEGESFDPTGMTVEAVYDNGNRTTVTDYTYAPDGALTPDVTFVTIAYADKTARQEITVREEERETYRFEAEGLSAVGTNMTFGNKYETHANGVSGMGYLGNTLNATMTLSVSADKPARAKVYAYADRGAGVSLNGTVSVAVTSDAGSSEPVMTETLLTGINWYTWQKMEIGTVSLSAGINEIVFESKANVNFDVFEIETAAALTRTDEPDGHMHSDWTVTQAPDENTEGRMYRYCDVCLEKETVILPPLSTEGAYTAESVEATEFVRGMKRITYHAENGDYEFTLTDTDVENAVTYRLETETFALTGLAPDSGNAGFIGANQKAGTASSVFTLSADATVTLGIHTAKGNAARYYLADWVRVRIDGIPVAIDDGLYLEKRSSGWYEVVEFDCVAVLELAAGEHTVELEFPSMPGGNLDCITMTSSAAIEYGDRI